jgi:hypothetical protein
MERKVRLPFNLNSIKSFIQDSLSTKGFQIYFSSPHPAYRSFGLDCSEYYEFGFIALHLYYLNIVFTNDRVEYKVETFYSIQKALFDIIKLDPHLHLTSPDFTTRFIAEQIIKYPHSTARVIIRDLYLLSKE